MNKKTVKKQKKSMSSKNDNVNGEVDYINKTLEKTAMYKIVDFGIAVKPTEDYSSILIKSILFCLRRSSKIKKQLGIHLSFTKKIIILFVDGDLRPFHEKTIREIEGISKIKSVDVTGDISIGYDINDYNGISDEINRIISIFTNIKTTIHPECSYSELVHNMQNKQNNYMTNVIENYTNLKKLTGNSIVMSVDQFDGVISDHITKINESTNTYIEILRPTTQSTSCVTHGADFAYYYKQRPKVNLSNSLTGIFDDTSSKLLMYKGGVIKDTVFDGDALCIYITDYINNILLNIKNEININITVGVVLSDLSRTICSTTFQRSCINYKIIIGDIRDMMDETDEFDISIVWDPMGNGTVCFKQRVIYELINMLDQNISDNCIKHIKILLALSDCFSNYCCDALSNLLVFKSILTSEHDLKKGDLTYTRMLKIRLRKHVKVECGQLVEPIEYKKNMHHLTNKYRGRIVLRMIHCGKGEDCCTLMLFSEGSTPDECDRLILNVAQLLYDEFDGVDDLPLIKYSSIDCGDIEQ